MTDVFLMAIVFFGLYNILKMFTDFLLKRRIIKTGHFEKAEILNEISSADSPAAQNENRYPTLKWGLVALFAGLGLLVNDLFFFRDPHALETGFHAAVPFGIELIFIAAGFLTYFFIVNKKK